MHVRLCGVRVAVAIHGQAIQYAHIDDIVAHVVVDTLGRVRHRLQKGVLLAAPDVGGAGAAGVNPRLALRRAEADGDILDRAAKARHRMTLKVAQHQEGIVAHEMAAHIIHRKHLSALDRQFHVALGVENIQLCHIQQTVVLCLLDVHGGGSAVATVGGVALHDGAVKLMDEVGNQLRPQVVCARALAGGHLHAHLAGQRHAQRVVSRDQALGRDLRDEIHNWRFFLCRTVGQALGFQRYAAVGHQRFRSGAAAKQQHSQKNE